MLFSSSGVYVGQGVLIAVNIFLTEQIIRKLCRTSYAVRVLISSYIGLAPTVPWTHCRARLLDSRSARAVLLNSRPVNRPRTGVVDSCPVTGRLSVNTD